MNRKVFNNKNLFIIISILFIITLSGVGFFGYHISTSIQDMFRLNAKLQCEGYYMGEFEFKMLGIAYWLDKGQYGKALCQLEYLHKSLETRSGLIKVPRFTDKQKELQFYLGLQNPRTGAFMDDSFPLFTYIGPTLNMVEHLKNLTKETGQPLHLKYPLRFLDRIASRKKLKIFLDDLSTVGTLGSKLPKTPYMEIAELCYYNDLERDHLYTFTPEWQYTLLKWLYENQDPETGFWGPRLRNNRTLLNSGDLGPTFHILKLFVDRTGQNRHSVFPLHYKNRIFTNTLRILARPMPADSDLDELHDWSLTRSQGINLITHYLWKSASVSNKIQAKKLMEELVINRYQKFYIPNQGAFSLYPGTNEATLDGTGTALDLLEQVGALSKEGQERLWGPFDQNIENLGIQPITDLRDSTFYRNRNLLKMNSIRFYLQDPSPNQYTSGAVGIFYPRKTPVLDTLELISKAEQWVHKTPQNMGNWVSKDSVTHQLATVKVSSVPVFTEILPVKFLKRSLANNQKIFLIGFDTLQIPRYKIAYYHY